MKLRIFCILILMMGMAYQADAQRAKRGKKPVKKETRAKAKTKAAAKKPVKKTAAKQKATARTAAGDDTTTLKSTTIEIIQSYKPDVKMAPKPEMQPSLPPADKRVPQMSYTVPPQSLYYTYSSTPLRPLALGRDTVGLGFQNYVKVGGGNLSTLMLDAGIGSLHGSNYESAIHVHHLSQSGKIENQKSSLTGLEAEGTLHTSSHAWHAALNVLRNQYHNYGYDHNLYDYTASQVRRSYTGMGLNVDMHNEDDEKPLSYHPSLGVLLYGDNYQASQRKVDMSIPVSYRVDTSLKLTLGISGSYATLNDSTTVSRGSHMFKMMPSVSFHKNGLSLDAGLYPTQGQSNFYLLPDVKVGYTIPKTQIGIYAGWQGQLRQNTYDEVSGRNPFVANSYNLKQTHTDEIFAGLQTNIGSHITLSGRVSYWMFENMPLFINDTGSDYKQFFIAYDKVNALSLQAALRYHVANTFAVGVSATYYGYNADAFRHAWHEPGVRINADLLVRPMPELVITGYASIMNGIYAMEKGGISRKLSAIADIGGSAEYSFIPRLSAFIQVNNILNNRYERWYGYQAYGFNIIGGIRFKF